MSVLRAVWMATILCLIAVLGYMAVTHGGGSVDVVAPATSGTAAAPPPAATDEERIAAIDRAWRSWIARHRVTKATLAIGHDGAVVHTAGIGLDPDTAVPVADLADAVTATCLARLFDARGLSFNLTLGEIKDQMSEIRVLLPIWTQDITIAQLVSHTSGLAPDITKGDLWGQPSGTEPRHRRIALAALAENAIQGKRGDFFYNNGNYAVLGAVIEAMTGLPYDVACTDAVLAPAGVTTANLAGPYASNSSFGGWDISAPDYLRFILHWTAPDQTWIAYPASYPQARTGAPGESYGLGLSRTELDGRIVLSHGGSLCIDDITARQVGAGVMSVVDGWSVVATWNACTPQEDVSSFLRTLFDAAR